MYADVLRILWMLISYALAEEGVINSTPLTDFTTVEGDQFKCSVPDMVVNGTNLDKSHFQSDFTSVSEIKFPGIVGPLQERVICKIKCIDGQWVGPLCAINEDGRFQPIFRECTLPESENTHLFLTFRNRSTVFTLYTPEEGTFGPETCRVFKIK